MGVQMLLYLNEDSLIYFDFFSVISWVEENLMFADFYIHNESSAL